MSRQNIMREKKRETSKNYYQIHFLLAIYCV